MIKIIFVILLHSQTVLSHTSKLSKITGKKINLSTIGHSFAGSINNKMVLGYKQQGEFSSKLTTITNDTEQTSSFSYSESRIFSGNIKTLENGQEKIHTIKFIKLIKEDNIYQMSFDDNVVEVLVKSDDFRSGHFINPTYSMNYLGEDISFKLERGEACYGYSLHLIAMIMGSKVFLK
jgi:hypothetical protein